MSTCSRTKHTSTTCDAETVSQHVNTTHKIVIFITVVSEASPFTSPNLLFFERAHVANSTHVLMKLQALRGKPVAMTHLLLMKHYKVLACSTVFFQLSLTCAIFFQLRTFILLISSKTSSSQRVLGLPIGLLDMRYDTYTSNIPFFIF